MICIIQTGILDIYFNAICLCSLLSMLENKIKDSQNDLNEEAAAELAEQSVDVSMMSLESTLKHNGNYKDYGQSHGSITGWC